MDKSATELRFYALK